MHDLINNITFAINENVLVELKMWHKKSNENVEKRLKQRLDTVGTQLLFRTSWQPDKIYQPKHLQ